MLAVPLYDDAPARRTPVVTYTIIGLCLVVFLWQQGLPADQEHAVEYGLGMLPAVLFGYAELPPSLAFVPPSATILTSMFLHGGWMHLLGNMLYLWIFGKGVENALGPWRFALLYLLSGVAAALTQGLMDPSSEVPMIGASGAIAGTLGAYLLLYPRGNVVVFFWLLIFVRLLQVPAVILLGLWFLLQLWSAAASGEPGVAFWAHVGGFLAGMLLVLLLRPKQVPLFLPSRTQAFTRSRSLPPTGRPRGPWGPYN
jgi:membrane associated rhomboid family serine protease